MKRVTKKLVNEALESHNGWEFAYDFKDSQRIYLFSWARVDKMKDHLLAKGIEVLECRLPESPCTGSMKLQMRSET